MTRLWQRVSGLLLLVVVLLIVEAVLQVVVRFSPVILTLTSPSWSRNEVSERWIMDDKGWILGGKPDYQEHDDRGYRNKTAYRKAELITIGDSFTYGSGVNSETAWPALLEISYGVPTYNMGISGSGPVEYLARFKRALQLNPRYIAVALWLGNDLIFSREMYDSVVAMDGVDTELLQAAMLLERKAPLWEAAASYVWCHYPQEAAGKKESSHATPSPASVPWWQQVHQGFSQDSRLYGLLRSLKDLVFRSRSAHERQMAPRDEYAEDLKNLLPDQLELCYPFASEGLYTVFNNGWRRRTLDITDPRIETGMRIMKSALVQMRNLARDAGVQLLVLVIPTKEHIYWPRIRAVGVNNPVSEQQLRFIGVNEPKLEEEIMQFMSAAGITSISLTSSLRKSRQQPYFGSRDAHINEQGHRIVAAELFRLFAHMPETR